MDPVAPCQLILLSWGGGEIDDSFWDGLGHQPRVSSI